MSLPRALALALVLLEVLAVGGDATPPKGHLEPFGAWRPGTPIEERTSVPSPREFFDLGNSDGGHGRPVVFRGAASGMAAMQWASDEYLLEHYADERITGVEYNLKETRAGGSAEHIKTMRDFVAEYNSTDIYMVSKVPKGMAGDISFLPCMNCGGFLSFLDVNNLWFGRGGSKSVVHYDDQDNINCMFAGQKRFIFMHPRYKKQFEAHPNKRKNGFGWVDTDLDRNIPGYGAFMKIDVDRMDLIKHPGWVDVEWSYVDLMPGDCVYIPYQWYHQVTAEPVKTINAHVWYWRPEKFDEGSCKKSGELPPPAFSDCTYGYEPAGGHLGKATKGGARRTKCKRPKTSNARAAAEL